MNKVEEILVHHGIKGQKWGVRRSKSELAVAAHVTSGPVGKIKTAGGTGHAHAEEAISAALIRQKAKGSSLDSLSNKELKEVVARMNLERQYNQLKVDRANPAAKFLSQLLTTHGKQQANQAIAKKAAKATAKLA